MKTVKVIGFAKRFRKADNEPFFVFNLFGGPVAHISSTGKLSISTPTITIPANTTDESVLAACVGMQMDGEIKSVECAPVEFTAKDGSTQIRKHEWKFYPAGSTTPLNVPESIPSDEVVEELAS